MAEDLNKKVDDLKEEQLAEVNGGSPLTDCAKGHHKLKATIVS